MSAEEISHGHEAPAGTGANHRAAAQTAAPIRLVRTNRPTRSPTPLATAFQVACSTAAARTAATIIAADANPNRAHLGSARAYPSRRAGRRRGGPGVGRLR